MARLTKEQWAEVRAVWEADARPGFDWLGAAMGLPITRQGVSDMAKRKGWTKTSGKLAQETGKLAQIKKEDKKLAQDKPPANVLQLVPSSPPAKGAGKGKAAKSLGMPPAAPVSTASGSWELVEKRPVGRPSEYREEFMQMMIDFFDIEVQKVEQIEVPDGQGGMTTHSHVVTNTFPTLERFASKIGITRETLHDWATAKNKDGTLRRPEFSYCYARARDLQGALMIEGGMAGVYEGRFTGLAAKNLIGWKDQVESKSEVVVTGSSIEELDRVYKDGVERAMRDKAAVFARNKVIADQKRDS